MSCRILLLDDHRALSQGLASLFAQEPDLEVGGLFSTGEDLLAYLQAAGPAPAEVLLLDLHLPPPLDGLALLPRLRQDWPALRVLVFSSATSPALIGQVAAAGAHGFLDKAAEADTLLAAIRAIHAGQLVFPKRLPNWVVGPPAAAGESAAGQAAEELLRLRQLTAREREIISLLREGLSNRGIAARLSLSEMTVSTHRRNIMQKLGLRGVAALLRFAAEYGL